MEIPPGNLILNPPTRISSLRTLVLNPLNNSIGSGIFLVIRRSASLSGFVNTNACPPMYSSINGTLRNQLQFHSLGPHAKNKRGKQLITISFPPPSGWYEFDRVIRNHKGDWVGGYSRNIGVANNIPVELWELRDGLQQAANLNTEMLDVEVDSQVAIDLINSIDPNDSLYCSIISYCSRLLDSFRSIRLHHAHQETDKTSGYLAWLGANNASAPSF
ncbi:hypothetical protein M9H77_24402 [Catharanthus roseus]|uniref:Uncharacterized protein n=1 Tax=Catharanthus roseus TaxID=4058 RepID=A0ACC0AW15_CATRO|nr:hypothetical protein M9H77_24402 [Catharanthus roseus]